MAVGYEKINTSAARSKRRLNQNVSSRPVVVEPSGVTVRCPTFGIGVTQEEFVSDCDSVRVKFESGVVTLRGSAIRAMRDIND